MLLGLICRIAFVVVVVFLIIIIVAFPIHIGEEDTNQPNHI